jgi:manganese/zinc/iron transport system substrate-binding protein
MYPDLLLKKGEVIDPHIWMDITLWQKGIAPIVEGLSQIDPEGRAYYQEQGALLSQEMEKTHLELKSRMQQIPAEKRYLVTSHDAFSYFTRQYLAEGDDWTDRFAAPEGLAPEGQLSSRDIQKIIQYLKKYQITVLFPESNVSRDAIRKIAAAGKELGLNVRICAEPLYGDAMNGLGYLEMMRHNAEVIAKWITR